MINLPVPDYGPEEKEDNIFGKIGKAISPVVSPIKEFVEAPWLGTQGMLPQFVGKAMQEASFGYIKPAIDEPETIEERVAAGAGSMLGFGFPLGKIGKLTRMAQVGEKLRASTKIGARLLGHLQIDHAIPAAIYGLVKDTGLPFGTPEDFAARRNNAVQTGAMVGGLSMATKFVQARVATRFIDAALPFLQKEPALRSMVTNFVTNTGVGMGLGILQPEAGLDIGTSALVGGLGFGIGGTLGSLGKGRGSYAEMKKTYNEFRDNLVKSGVDVKEANRIINNYSDGKLKPDEMVKYHEALKVAKTPEEAAKIAADISIKTSTQYGEKVGQKETPQSLEARAKAQAEAKQKAQGGNNQQTDGKIKLSGEAAVKKVREDTVQQIAVLKNTFEANPMFGKKWWDNPKNKRAVDAIIKDHFDNMERGMPGQESAQQLFSLRSAVMQDPIVQSVLSKSILDAESIDRLTKILGGDHKYFETKDDADVIAIAKALDMADKGNLEPLKTIAKGKRNSIEAKRMAKKELDKVVKDVVKELKTSISGKLSPEQQIQQDWQKKNITTKERDRRLAELKPEPTKQEKTQEKVAEVEKKVDEKTVKERAKHIGEVEKKLFGREKTAEEVLSKEPEKPESYIKNLAELQKTGAIKRDATEVATGKEVYASPQVGGYAITRVVPGTPGTTNIERAIKFHRGNAGIGITIVLDGDKIMQSKSLKAFAGADTAYKGKINVRGEMNMPDASEVPDYILRTEFDEYVPLDAMKGIIATEGRYNPKEFEKYVNIIADHNRRYPEDLWTITVLKDTKKIKVNYDRDTMDIRDIYNKNIEEAIEPRVSSEYSHRGEDTIKLNEEMSLAIGKIIRTLDLYKGRMGYQGIKELGGELRPIKDVNTLRDVINEAMSEVGFRSKKSLEEQHEIWLSKVRTELDRSDIDLDTPAEKLKESYKRAFGGGSSTDSISLDKTVGVPDNEEIPDYKEADKILKEIQASNLKDVNNGEFSVGKWGKELERLDKKIKSLIKPTMPQDTTVELLIGERDSLTKKINYVKYHSDYIRKWLAPVKIKEGRKTYMSTLHERPGKLEVKDKQGKVLGGFYKHKPPFKTTEYDLAATAGFLPSERDKQGELKSLFKRQKDLEEKRRIIQDVLTHVEYFEKQQKKKDAGIDVDAEISDYVDSESNKLVIDRVDNRPFEDEETWRQQVYDPEAKSGGAAAAGKIPSDTIPLDDMPDSIVVKTMAGVDKIIKPAASEDFSIDPILQSDGVTIKYQLHDGQVYDIDKATAQKLIKYYATKKVNLNIPTKERGLRQDWQSISLIPGVVDKFDEYLKLTPEEDINRRGATDADAPNFAFKEGRNAEVAMQQFAKSKGKEISSLFDKMTEGMDRIDKIALQEDVYKSMHEISVDNPNDIMSISRSEFGMKELDNGTSAWDRLTPEQQKFTAQLKATYKAMSQVMIQRGLLDTEVWDETKEGYAPIVHLDPQGRPLASLFVRSLVRGSLKERQKTGEGLSSYEENLALAKGHKSRLMDNPGELFTWDIANNAASLGRDHTARTLEQFKDSFGRPALVYSRDLTEDNKKFYVALDDGKVSDTRGLSGVYERFIGKGWKEPLVLRDLDDNGNPTDSSATARWLNALAGKKGGELMLHPSVRGYARVKGLMKQLVLTNPAYITWQAYNSFIPVLNPFGAAREMFKYASFKHYNNMAELRNAAERSGVRVGDEILRSIYDDFVKNKEEGGKSGKIANMLDTFDTFINDKYTLRKKLFNMMEGAAVQSWEIMRAKYVREQNMDPKRAGVVAAEAINLAMGSPDKTTFDGFTNFVSNMAFLARNNQISAMRMFLGAGMKFDPEARFKKSQMFGFHGYTPQERKALGDFFWKQIAWQTLTWASTSALVSYFLSGGLMPWQRQEDPNKALMIHTGVKRSDGSEVLVDAPIFKDARDLLQLFTGPIDYARNKMDPTAKLMVELLMQGQILPGEKGLKPFSEPGTPLPEHITNIALKKFFGFAGFTKLPVAAIAGQEFVNKYGSIYPTTPIQEASNFIGFRQGVGIGGPGKEGAAVRAGLKVQQKETLARTNLRNDMLNAYISGNDLRFNNIMVKLYPDAKVRAKAIKEFRLKMSNPAAYQLKKWKDKGPAEIAYFAEMAGTPTINNPLGL